MFKKSRFILLGIIFAFIFVGYTAFSSVKRQILKNERINILLLGVSETDSARFLEVVKLISYEPKTGFLDIISIPRDTKISVPKEVTWRRIQKLEEIYARFVRKYKNSENLFLSFKGQIEDFLKNRFEIDYYIQIDCNAVVEFVDALGGVELEVLRNMKYVDKSQNLEINISTGIHILTGDKALNYVRYRDVTGDIGRLRRQHRFLMAVLENLKSFTTLRRMPALMSSVINNVRTNLKISDILVIVDEIRNFNVENFRLQKLPGKSIMRWRKSYWKVDEAGLREIIEVVSNSSLINLPAMKVDSKSKLNYRITAEVWNATNKRGMALKLTRYLRKRNVDVKRHGNFGTHRKHTQIISRTGDLKQALAIARIIGCRNIKTELDSSRMVDVDVIIGYDFKDLWTE